MRSVCIRPLIFLIALLWLTACQDEQAKLAEHLSRGEAYVEEERFPEAIIEYRSALQIEPNHAAAHYALAHAYIRSGKAREGFWELRETVRLDPANHEAKLEFSQIAIFAEEHEEALKQADSVIADDPQNVRAYLIRSQALGGLDRKDEAFAAVEKAVEIGPEDEAALRSFAMVQNRLGNFEEAEALYRRLVVVAPTFASRTEFARFLGRRGKDRSAESEAAFLEALEAAEGEDRTRGYGQLASFYYRSRRSADAIALLEKGIATEEHTLQLIYLLARLQRAEGNEAEADALIEQTATARPDDARVYLVLSSYRGRKGNREGALEAAEQALVLEPDNVSAKLRKAEVLMELGFRKEREGAVEESQILVDEVLLLKPSHPGALLVGAKIKLARQEHQAAIQQTRAAIDGRPDWAEAHYILGLALAVRKEYAPARTELARALELDAGLLDANKVIAQVHSKLGEHEYATERLRRYLRESPDDLPARLLLAQSLARLQDLRGALRELDAIPPEARNAEVHYALGRVQNRMGNHAAARENMMAANAAEPGNAEILRDLLRLDRREKRFEESVTRINAAVEANPENAKLRLLEGEVARVQGRPEDAEKSFEKAIELDPSDLASYERLAQFHARRGRMDETAKTYERALLVKPSEARLHHLLGVLYELSGESNRAIERYEEAIRYNADLAEAKNNLAYLYANDGKSLDRALDLAQDAKTLLPDNPSVADTLGWVLYKRDVPSAAIGYLKEAEAGTDPKDASLAEVRHHLALAYAANGDNEEAVAALDRAFDALRRGVAEVEKRGGDPGPEPEWATEARSLRERLSSDMQAASANPSSGS
jgi:tetratricopeptide (TPR) repeat protein